MIELLKSFWYGPHCGICGGRHRTFDVAIACWEKHFLVKK